MKSTAYSSLLNEGGADSVPAFTAAPDVKQLPRIVRDTPLPVAGLNGEWSRTREALAPVQIQFQWLHFVD